MKINDLKIKVTEIVNSNIGKIDIKKLNSIMSLLLNLIKTLVNTLLSRGIDLNIFLRNLPAALKDIHISPRDGYYLLMANPYFDTQSVPRLLELLAGDEGLLKSDRTHSDILKKSLAKGLSAFYETFDKHTHLNRPGAAPLKALISSFEIYQPLIARGEEAHRNME